jgi:phage baseplate assembly protein gpV
VTTTDVIGVVQAVVREELRGFRTAELGVVTALYPHESAGDRNNYECDVRLRDSSLELKRVPVATQRIGAVAIPNVNDLVLVQFLQGDVHSALITARLYNDQDRPPEAHERELVYVSPDPAASGVRRLSVELPNGNKLLVDDDQLVLEMGSTTLTVKHDGEVVVDSGSQNITLTDQGGGNAVTIDVQQNQATVKAGAKVVVDAPQIELTSGAAHPLVFGDQLLTYLNQLVSLYQSHVHPGEMALGVFPVSPAPPVPPVPPPTPALNSTRVQTG